MNFDKEDKALETLLQAGAEITGSAISGAVSGFLVSGIPGAIGGGVAGAGSPLLKRMIMRTAGDIGKRLLSERERVRVGGLTIYATSKIQEKLAVGKTLRNDGFFDKRCNEHVACAEIPVLKRPDAEEIFEGVLLAAQREHEEKKIPFLGNLLANIAFDPNIDIAQANMLLRIGRDLSYRQLCLLSIFENSEKFGMRDKDYCESILFDDRKASLLQEIYALEVQDLLVYPLHPIIGSSAITPSEMRLQPVAYMLYQLMELWKIEKDELDRITSLLK